VVWLGFNLEWHGFDRLRQPRRGLALILTVCVLATGITLAFALGYGSLDPTFAGGRAEGTGYLGTFFLYFHVLAGGLLHEPPMTENIDGNTLGWMDWMVLWTLFYVLCLQSWGLPKPATT
jgi:hypothetical protein